MVSSLETHGPKQYPCRVFKCIQRFASLDVDMYSMLFHLVIGYGKFLVPKISASSVWRRNIVEMGGVWGSGGKILCSDNF